MIKVAILDDYQNVAQEFVELKKLSGKYEIKIFSEPFNNEEEAIENLKEYEALLIMRERTPITKNLINKSTFLQMKNKPIIINTSRGSIINENDLIDAYHNDLISGFALDVFENEPIKSEFYKKISSDMNCILTPHISGVTTESNIRVSDFIVKKTTEFFNQ